jgi:CBS domain-containing protein
MKVKDLMLPLDEYAVVHEDDTVLDALRAMDEARAWLAEDRQPHRAVLVRDSSGAIVGKMHQFAFLRALIPERGEVDRDFLERAGVDNDLLATSRQTLDLLTADLVDICARARSVSVGRVCTRVSTSIDESASLFDAIGLFLEHQTQSLLVRRGRETVGILRLIDLFDELARRMKSGDCREGGA